MRVRWRGLELPAQVQRDEETSTDKYGCFSVEPFERGFGTTVGNSLRRILLSSIEGAAITHARISEADHEFTTIPGIVEDVTDIVLNIKNMVVEVDGELPRKLRLEHSGKGVVTAGEFECETGVRVYDKNHVIATLTEDKKFSLELTAARGRGYSSAADHVDDTAELGLIAVDSLFSPVTRVRYRTEETRVGQRTNFDCLILEVWTKGTISPESALVEAAKILRKHLNPFVQYFDLGEATAAAVDVRAASSGMDPELARKLAMPVTDLDLSVRSNNCLEAGEIATVGQLIVQDETSLMQLRSFGKTSLDEIQAKLTEIGLSLGMNLESLTS